MSEFKYANPRHRCPALGNNAIIPKVCRMINGQLVPWGFKCPFCSQGREFTQAEREDYIREEYEASLEAEKENI